MYVQKRDGRQENVSFDKVTSRISKLCSGLDPLVDPIILAQKVVQGIYPGVTTSELDELASQTAAALSTKHPDFGRLAARISVSNLHKKTPGRFSEVVELLHACRHPKTGEPAALVADDVYDIVMANKDRLDAAIKHEHDFDYDFFGFKTLERSYLLKVDGHIIERPQYMLMRVAVGIHKGDMDSALETYTMLSERLYTHATPTLFNAGTPRPQMSSCFLLTMQADSIEGIYGTLKQCACISKYAGGIGLAIHDIRAGDSYIRGTNGTSNGIVPMLRVFNNTARYVDQGGGKRKGAMAVYLEPWHADIFGFLELRKNHGNEAERARDLFYALWIPGLFMRRVESDGQWSLFCPNEAPGLADAHGAAFDELYERYESEGRQRRSIRAQELWFAILTAQVETGNPFMLYKDACNAKSNQQNLGTIRSSNLCTEVVQYTSPDEVAVCNLGSINLGAMVRGGAFDFDLLRRVAGTVTRNLNKVIDANFYPIQEARRSNLRHRPIGIGVQGLADTFFLMRYPYDSAQARQLNKDIFETIYYGAVEASVELAEQLGPYDTYEGSPASKGQLQFDLWGVTPSDRWDWAALKERLAAHGLRNSLLVAPMPTASTAQILGNNEGTEPVTSNMYTRRTLAGEFTCVNKYLLKDLVSRGIWDDSMRNQLMAAKGSVQNIPCIPPDLRSLYKTVWEIKQRVILDMAADRGPYICQSQSMNVHIAEVTHAKLTSLHFHAFKLGLKTGMYYLRTRPKADAIQFTVDQLALKAVKDGHAAAAAAAGAAGAAGAGAATQRPGGAQQSPSPATTSEDEEECLSCGA